MPTAPTVERIRALAAEELPRLVAIRHDLHMHPEVGYEEVRTSQVIARELRDAGVRHVTGLAGGTGILAHLPAPAGECVGLRADIDALPIHERAPGRAHASRTPGRMHACGHDGHVAVMLGTARVLARLAAEATLPRPVTLVFQPAEEGGAGGKRMVEDGALDGSRLGPRVTSIHALHGWPELPLGTVATRVGPIMAASDRFQVTVEGAGAHAAWPHRAHDPVVCAAAIVTALQSIVARNVDPLDAAVVSVTVLQAGDAFNVIPERVVIKGTQRSLSESTRALVERRIAEVAEGVARAHGCRATVDIQRNYPVTVNDAGAVAEFERVARESLGADRVRTLAAPVMGGEDFAFYGPHARSCYWALGLAPGGAPYPPLHAPDFDFNDDAIATGVEVMCALAVR
jgi:amidohydrolase